MSSGLGPALAALVDRAGVVVLGDELPEAQLTPAATSRAAAVCVVYGIDLTDAVRPCGIRSVFQQRMAELQAILLSRFDLRRAIVLVRVRSTADLERVRTMLEAVGHSVHRRVEMSLGRPLTLTIVAIDERTPATELHERIAEGARYAGDDVAVLAWREVATDGIRTAAAAQRL